MKKFKKTLSLILALVMCLGMVSTSVVAAGGRELAQTINAGTVTKYVGEDGFYQRLPRLTLLCPRCGGVAIEYIPDADAYGDTVEYDDDIVNNLTAFIGGYRGSEYGGSYSGYDCYEMTYTAKTPGATPINITLDYSYDAPYEEGYCDFCSKYIVFYGNYTDYYDQITINVRVVTDYTVTYQGEGVTTNTQRVGYQIASVNHSFTAAAAPADRTVNGKTYTFNGWLYSGNGQTYAAGASVPMTWETSDGRNVQETMTAQWKEKDNETTYTLIREYYIDGEKIADTKSYNNIGNIGDEIVGQTLADKNPSWANRTVDGVKYTFNYAGCDPTPSLTLVAGENVITLRYEENTKTYTVIYKDGVGGSVFGDESHGNLKAGDKTPAFLGSTNRTDYAFMGWNPAVNSKVAKADANTNGEIIYTATWKKNPEEHTVTYTWSGLPDNHSETLPTGGTYAEGAEVTVNDTYTSTTKVTVGGTTYVFSGWAVTVPAGITIANGKFTMPASNVTINGTWRVKTPEKPLSLKVVKSGTDFVVDPESGNATVNYTVNVTNTSGRAIYGLRLTDAMTVTEGADKVNLKFSNWSATVTSTSEDGLTHVLQLLDRGATFADNATVTLTYTVEIESKTNDAAEVKLENNAKGDAWSKAPAARIAPMKVRSFVFASDAATNDDTPDVSGEGGTTVGGSTGGTTSGGQLPAKYTLSYSWDLPNGATPVQTLPASANRPAGSHFQVAILPMAGDKVTVDGATYTFSGWTVPAGIETETEEGDYKGQYIMPAQNVTITGTWTKHEHSWTEKTDNEGHTVWADGKAPTCTEDGTAIYECSCGATKEEVKEGSKRGHDFGAWTDDCNGTEAKNCTGHTHTCSRCRVTEKKSHDFGDWITDTAATMETEGTKHRVCKDCGHIENGTIPTLNKTTITIKYEDENGDEVGTSKDVVVEKGKAYDVTGEIKAPEGYEVGTEPDNAKGTATDDAITVTVSVKKIEYTVAFNSNGGSAVANQTVKHGEKATKPETDPTRNGYTFNGWNLGNAAYDFDTPVTADITLVARWSQNYVPPVVIPTYYTLTIHYVYADGTTAAPDVTRTLVSGGNYSVDSPVIEGYTPDRAVVSGNLYASDTLTVTYTANAIPQHTVTVRPVDEAGSPIGEDVVVTVAEGENYAVSVPVVEGYTTEQTEVTGIMGTKDTVVTVTYTRNPEETDIGDDNPPLVDNPDVDPDPDVDTPPEEVDIGDEDTPLVDVPQTGDLSMGWYVALMLSICGLVLLNLKRRKILEG